MRFLKLTILFSFLSLSTIHAQQNSYFSIKDDGTLYDIITLDGSGYLTVGTDQSMGVKALQLVKWDASFNELWSFEFPNTEILTHPALTYIKESRSGSYYLSASTDDYEKAVVFKISSSGNLLWQKSYSISGNMNMSAFQKGPPGDDGFIFGTGACSVSNGVVKCDANGDIEWQKRFSRSDAGGVVTCSGIVNDGAGYIVTSSFDVESFVNQKLDGSGNLVNYEAYQNSSRSMKTTESIAYNGGIAILGNYNGSNNNIDNFICYVNSDLTVNMYNHLELTNGSYMNLGHFTVDGSGQNIILNGYNLPGSNPTGTSSVGFALSLSSAGTLNWGYNSTEQNYFNGITAWGDRIISVGRGRDFTIQPNNDFPIVNIMGDTGAGLCDSTLLPIAVTQVTLTHLTGTTSEFSTTSFTVDTPTITPVTDIPFSRTMICGVAPLSLSSNDEVDNLSIYPNPNDGIINLKIEDHQGPVKTEVYSTFGRLIYANTFDTNSSEHVIDLSKVKTGTYFIKIYANGELHTEKLMITK
jgi:hypothetical protein